MKKEIGEIIQILKSGATAEYKVRLARGEVVVFPYTLIRPSRNTLLDKGTRLMIEHDLGRVVSASTDLAVTRPGVVTAVQRRPGSIISYQVDVDQAGTLQLSQDLIQPHPQGRSMMRGAALELVYEGSRVSLARLIRETETVRVARVNLDQRTITVAGAQSGETPVRLAVEDIRQLRVGEELDLEITYTAEGKSKYHLSRKPARPDPKTGQGPAEAARPQAERPRAEALETEAYGLDLTQLEKVKREGHRPEIVSFLERHARDGLIEWYDLKPGRPARFQAPARPLQAPIQRAIQASVPEFKGFFQHQALALDAIRAGRSLVVVTKPPAGKPSATTRPSLNSCWGTPRAMCCTSSR